MYSYNIFVNASDANNSYWFFLYRKFNSCSNYTDKKSDNLNAMNDECVKKRLIWCYTKQFKRDYMKYTKGKYNILLKKCLLNYFVLYIQ